MSEQEFQDDLWQEIVSRAGKTYQTHKGASFTYHIKEDRSGETSGVLMIDGKMKRITRATVLLAYHRVRELQEKHGCVSKPGKIGVYGDVWLYPVFLDIGICTREKGEQLKPLGSCRKEPEETGPAMRVCSQCGYTTEEDFEFCPKCGKKF